MNSKLLHAVQTDFAIFQRVAFAELHGDPRGNDSYLDLLCDRIERFARTPGDLLIINMPPGHLKTFTATVCGAAWMLAQNPAKKIITISNSESLAKANARQIRAIMRASLYRKAFPRTCLAHETLLDFGTTAGGGVYAVSIDGAFTGRRADIIIIDDPLQIADASNPKRLQKVNDLYDGTIQSRLNNPKSGRIMVVAHRIHRDDLCGHLIRQGGWDVLKLPFIAPRKARYDTQNGTWIRKKGELLRPGEFTKKQIKKLQQTANFEALYQQNPENGIEPITADCFLPFLPTKPPSSAPVVLSVDPGHIEGPDNSCTVIQAWCPYEGQHILLDQFRESCSFGKVLRTLKKFIGRHRPSTILIENTGYGPGLRDEIEKRFEGELVPVRRPIRSKSERLATHLKYIRRGGIRLLAQSECAGPFIQELVQFPNGSHDDIVDALSQYLDYMASDPVLPERAPRGTIARLSRSAFSADRAGNADSLGRPVVVGKGRAACAVVSRGRLWRF